MIKLLEPNKKLVLAYNKPKDILHQLDTLVIQSLAHSILQIEELIADQLISFAQSFDNKADNENIKFKVEVVDYKFKFIPENFYTYLLSEGVQTSYKKVEHRKYLKVNNTEYYFNPVENYGVTIQPEALRLLKESK